MIHRKIKRDLFSGKDPEGLIEIYLGNNLIINYQITTICTQSYYSTLTFYINCNYLNNNKDELHDQIQAILDYMWIMFFWGGKQEITCIDTIELIDMDYDKNIEQELSVIPYDKYKLKDISFEQDYIISSKVPNKYPEISQYKGNLIKNNLGKVEFEFDDYDILVNLTSCASYISISRAFYLNYEALLKRDNEGFISIRLYSDMLEILIKIKDKETLISEIEIIDYKYNIYNVVEYIFNYFTPEKFYINIDLLMGYVKLNKEKLENILKLNINWDKDKNEYCENKNRVYKKGILEKDDNGNFRLIINS
jgi:hypothetical protein